MYEKITVPGLSADENDYANAMLDRLERRSHRNMLRSSYYDGKRAARHVSAVLPPMYQKLGLTLGWSAKAVDALARRCHIDGYTWADGELDDLGMVEFSEENMLLSELSAARTKAFIHGVSFLINTVGGEDEPASLLHMKDALNATGEWNARTRQMDSLLSVNARKDNAVTAFTLYLDGETVYCEKDGRWSVADRQEHAYGVPVEAVIYKPQGREFGYSRISRPIMGLQDAAVRALGRVEGHMDIYSFPEMWMLGADKSIFTDDQGNTLPDWRVMLGRIKGIPDDENADNPRADVKQFAASSPDPHLAQINALAKLFARESSLPDSAVAISDFSNPTSADSYDASQYELIAEAEGACADFDRAMARSVRRGLQILNGEADLPDEWLAIRPKWRGAKFESSAAAADAGTKMASAIPGFADTDVGLEVMGLTEDQIRRLRADQRRTTGRATLDALATAGAVSQGADDAVAMKAKFDALGAAIRSGVDPESAAAALGLSGLAFTGAIPVSLRPPAAEASKLEQQ